MKSKSGLNVYREEESTMYTENTRLYGIEAWILNATFQNKINAFEMWVGIQNNSGWMDIVTNEEILKRIGKQREIIDKI